MPPKILIVEDAAHKGGRIMELIKQMLPTATVVEARSFTTGCQAIISNSFDLVVLDMSLPTYDRSISETGGRFRTFGGREIARKLLRRGGAPKVVFLTQYESFSDKRTSYSLEALRDELRVECAEFFLALIHYDSSRSSWKEQLSQELKRLV